ncbi:phosphonate ABC transporter ATP-binding protein [Ramlibacter tataouinensis]|uniref:Candidate ABC type phosphate/phosphonate transport systems, ATP-binding component n=1 Tax=Ramlibacter tataouinensis (strain ATCC BAA-407 / DSM 14655 / LMG 21543 / TTB310) TaxID=365046 RepID=F5XYV2_RAMTT|nr:ATP-binding cassette domain-containing protein [Ramlibacter tataouinensis]AEG94469.1 candidate ABC type phosphate/phosphonate transport systems, ATP-binding component [Ramlibacter tataouinensis TTB310]
MEVGLSGVSLRHPAAARGAAPALQEASLQLSAGEQVAVIGPSGAGKTSLLQAMACALRPVAGRISLGDRDPWALPARELRALRGRLFLAPQVPPLPPRQRVVTAVLAGTLPRMGVLRSLRSLFYPVGIAEAEAALARFDLDDKLFARVDRLSGGERQRVGLARALVAEARLLLVDEPLSALDPARADQAMDSLTQAAGEQGATLVCTLHHVPMALRHFPRILGLQGGRVAFDLPASQVTPELLRTLYAQHPEELDDRAPASVRLPEAAVPVPVVMHCR